MSENLELEYSFEDVKTGKTIEKNTIVNHNSIKINIDLTDEYETDKDKILGYEIIRNDGNILPEGEKSGTIKNINQKLTSWICKCK